MSQKRKKVVLSVESKLEAIKRLDKGESIRKIAFDYGVGETTVGDWRRKRTVLEQFATKCGDAVTNRKTMKRAEYDKIDKGLFLWFIEMREKGLPLSNSILKTKALALGEQYPGENEPFTASTGWLNRWKKRHGVHKLSKCGKTTSVDKLVLKQIKEEFEELVEKGSSHDPIYNGDETDLNFSTKPSNVLASREEGCIKNKERVTISSCNASKPHKFPRKSSKPKAIKHTEELTSGDDSEQELTDDEIVNFVEVIVEDNRETEESLQVTHEEGLNALEIALKYVEEQPESNEFDLVLMRRWRDIAASKRMNQLKYRSITE